MQRAAAITGPTPAFVRWAINRPCQLREVDEERLPETTFRQLRSIHELALARRQNRVFQNVAFHPDTKLGEELLGFLPVEVLEASGGEARIQEQCSNCVANTQREMSGWVGCFGMARIDAPEFISGFEAAIERLGIDEEIEQSFPVTHPRWFGVWMTHVLDRHQVGLLIQVMNELELGREWEQFRTALSRCWQNNLELHVEYFPSGNSDGRYWKWDPHCDACRSNIDFSVRKCECCGRKRIEQSAKKRKVLGLRPYMKLRYVLGESKCVQLVREYVDWKVRTSSDQ